jgi:GTPase SAR1 family protein
MYDITNKLSFRSLEELLEQDLNEFRYLDAALVVVGTKCDLAHIREVSVEEGQALANRLGNNTAFFEASAKHGINVDECMESFISVMRRNEADAIRRVQEARQRMYDEEQNERKKDQSKCVMS